jgi:hypothetical protein
MSERRRPMTDMDLGVGKELDGPRSPGSIIAGAHGARGREFIWEISA